MHRLLRFAGQFSRNLAKHIRVAPLDSVPSYGVYSETEVRYGAAQDWDGRKTRRGEAHFDRNRHGIVGRGGHQQVPCKLSRRQWQPETH